MQTPGTFLLINLIIRPHLVVMFPHDLELTNSRRLHRIRDEVFPYGITSQTTSYGAIEKLGVGERRQLFICQTDGEKVARRRHEGEDVSEDIDV